MTITEQESCHNWSLEIVWLSKRETEATVQAEVAPHSVTTEQGSQHRHNRRDIIQLPDPSDRVSSDSQQTKTSSATTIHTTCGLRQSSHMMTSQGHQTDLLLMILLLNIKGRDV